VVEIEQAAECGGSEREAWKFGKAEQNGRQVISGTAFSEKDRVTQNLRGDPVSSSLNSRFVAPVVATSVELATICVEIECNKVPDSSIESL
jgi:hypothetical protein